MMKLNLKALGLALVAMFAFSAVAVSSASAQTGKLTTEGQKAVTLTGTETGPVTANRLRAFGGETTCPGSTYSGHEINGTARVPNGATEVTVTPKYKQTTAEGKINCKASGLPATVTTNGCDFEFYDFTTDATKTHNFTFLTRIDCKHENRIEVEAYLGEGEGIKACTITVGDTPKAGGATVNQALAGGRVTNTAASGGKKNDLDLTGTITNIHVERSGLCVSEDITTVNTGEFDLDVTVTGDDEFNSETGITISD